jgi:GNAT superfamily N-acetyltransferase
MAWFTTLWPYLGLVCVDGAGHRAGAPWYRIADGELEVVSIDATTHPQGTGTALLEAAIGVARSERCRRAGLVTTNDNLDALRFYQRATGAWSGSAAVPSTPPVC